MIKSVTITNYLGLSVTMELRFPEKSGFLVRSIEGLGPTKADINTTDMLTKPGSLFNSAHITSRNIIFTVAFQDSPTIEGKRLDSYKLFPIGKLLKMVVETDERTSVVYGYVESNEPNIFSNEETAVISVVCPDPFFYAQDSVGIDFNKLVPSFEFPFDNNSLTVPLIEFGTIELMTANIIDYEGDFPTGVVINIHALGPVTELKIDKVGSGQFISIDDARLIELMGTGIDLGDTIVINTTRGQKGLTLIRDGLQYNILNALTIESSWFEIDPGENALFYNAKTGTSNIQLRVEHQVIYAGV